MTVKQTSYEAGTVGTAITTTNHGGDAFVAVAGTQTFQSAGPAPLEGMGTKYARLGAATASTHWQGYALPTSTSTPGVRVYVYLTARYAAMDIFQLLTLGPTTNRSRIRINADGTLQCLNNAAAAGTPSATPIPLNQWVRIEANWNLATTTTGSMSADWYIGHSGVSGGRAEALNQAFSLATATDLRLGSPTVSVANLVLNMDGLAVSDTGRIGPAVTTPVNQTATPNLLPSSPALLAPSALGVLTSTPARLDSSPTLFAPSAAAGVPAQTASPPLLFGSQALFAPTASTTLTASPPLLSSGPALLAPSVTQTQPPPGAILNIGPGANQNHFALQMAPDGASSIQTITQDQIAAGFTDPVHFFTTSDGWVQVSPRIDGPTTSGTTFARDELRELNADGSNMKFNALVGEHWFELRTRIVSVPSEDPDVVVMQLHNGDADRLAVRTQMFSSGAVVFGVRVNGALHSTRIQNPWVPNTDWLVRTRILDGGAVEIYANGALIISLPVGTLVQTAHPDGWYWKGGAYNQFAPGAAGATGLVPPADARSVVQFKDLAVYHSNIAVVPPTITATPDLLTSSPALLSPSAAVGPAPATIVTPDRVSSAPTLFQPTASTTLQATPDRAASPAVLQPPAALGVLTAVPDRVSSTPTLHAPAASSILAATPNRVDSSPVLFAPTAVVAGPIVATPDRADSTPTLHAPTARSVLSAAPDRLDGEPQLYSPSITNVVIIGPDQLSGDRELFEPTVETTLTAEPDPLAREAILHAPDAELSLLVEVARLESLPALFPPTFGDTEDLANVPIMAKFVIDGAGRATFAVDGRTITLFRETGLGDAAFTRDGVAAAHYQEDGTATGTFERDGVGTGEFAADGIGAGQFA